MQQRYHHFASLLKVDDQVLREKILVFNVEDTLLKSSSMFPYFMLVAFEGGGPLRALILLILYPFLSILREELRLEVMVFVCFFGINKDKFRIGRNVLPKFFLEDVGYESLKVVMKFGRKVGVSNLPRVMVEVFVKDYLGIEEIVGREIGAFGRYYSGLLVKNDHNQTKMFEHNQSNQTVGICGANDQSFNTRLFTYLKDIYLVSKDCKKRWNNLPRDKLPKPLIFHDGRLIFMPTPLNTLVMFMWLPFGMILGIIRLFMGTLLPYPLSTPILAFLGVHLPYSGSKHSHMHNNASNHKKNSSGRVYVCNHKTLIDPVAISQICQMNLIAPYYSLSKLSKFLSPIDTIALTRDREKDAAAVSRVLSQRRSMVICPEGTTCREPYLLRFSPLFAELSDDITPIAVQVDVTMFFATTASGIKAFDPFFFIMNPWPIYYVKFLENLPHAWTCGSGGRTKFEVANYVQDMIGKALGYKCTSLTRKDKYMMLAENNGLVN